MRGEVDGKEGRMATMTSPKRRLDNQHFQTNK